MPLLLLKLGMRLLLPKNNSIKVRKFISQSKFFVLDLLRSKRQVCIFWLRCIVRMLHLLVTLILLVPHSRVLLHLQSDLSSTNGQSQWALAHPKLIFLSFWKIRLGSATKTCFYLNLVLSTPEQNRASRRRESAPLDWNWPD
jgi:hypothetical protein